MKNLEPATLPKNMTTTQLKREIQLWKGYVRKELQEARKKEKQLQQLQRLKDYYFELRRKNEQVEDEKY